MSLGKKICVVSLIILVSALIGCLIGFGISGETKTTALGCGIGMFAGLWMGACTVEGQ